MYFLPTHETYLPVLTRQDTSAGIFSAGEVSGYISSGGVWPGLGHVGCYTPAVQSRVALNFEYRIANNIFSTPTVNAASGLRAVAMAWTALHVYGNVRHFFKPTARGMAIGKNIARQSVKEGTKATIDQVEGVGRCSPYFLYDGENAFAVMDKSVNPF